MAVTSLLNHDSPMGRLGQWTRPAPDWAPPISEARFHSLLAKQLTFMANADAAGVVLGARVPIVLTSRSDNVRTRLASCAVSLLVAHARRTGLPDGADMAFPDSRGQR